MTFKAKLKTSLGWHWDDGATDDDALEYSQKLADGNGDNQAEAVWHAEDQFLPDGQTLTLDLTALQREILGDLNTVTLLGVKALLLQTDAGSAGTLVVGGAAESPWSGPFAAAADQLIVAPGGLLALGSGPAGWPVSDSRKNLQLSASGGDVTWSLAIVGTLTAAGSGSGSGSGQ